MKLLKHYVHEIIAKHKRPKVTLNYLKILKLMKY